MYNIYIYIYEKTNLAQKNILTALNFLIPGAQMAPEIVDLFQPL